MIWQEIARKIGMATEAPYVIAERTVVSGGCINEAWRLKGRDGRLFFAKLNHAGAVSMFAAESAGLRQIMDTNTVAVPAPICRGTADNRAFLVLEYLSFGKGDVFHHLGRQLAAMHRCLRAGYGWSMDGAIGSTPQINTPVFTDWPAFWREQRLGYQLRLAREDGHGERLQRKGELLLESFPALFAAYTPPASLLHGDLWSGNQAVTQTGRPVVFDPAVYYGDRETDIAMTELFGGFPASFYSAYNEAWPLDSGYAVRRDLYNLYHVLNHLHLFGAGYLRQSEEMMDRLLSELR